MQPSPGKIDAFDIDDYTVEANADVDLNVTAQDMAKTLQDRQVRLLVEVKDPYQAHISALIKFP